MWFSVRVRLEVSNCTDSGQSSIHRKTVFIVFLLKRSTLIFFFLGSPFGCPVSSLLFDSYRSLSTVTKTRLCCQLKIHWCKIEQNNDLQCHTYDAAGANPALACIVLNHAFQSQ